MNNNIVIYTCITGGYDVPTDCFEHKEGYDYIIFSDKPLNTKSWENKIISFPDCDGLNNIKKQRYVKTHPFELLPDYDIAVWIDANTSVNNVLYEYIENNKDNLITFKKHPNRDCIYDEIKVCQSIGKEKKEIGDKVIEKLNQEAYPKHNGLFETNIIVSHANNRRVKELFRNWWEEIRYNSHRDQFSLNYVIWKYNMSDFVSITQTMNFRPKPHIRRK